MNKNKVTVIIAILLILPGCLENLNGSPADKISEDSFNGIGLSPVEIEDFMLINQHNENVSLSDYEGKVIVVAFTYTTCPDVCPIIEHNLKLVQDLLGDNYGKDVVFISITLDPARDTSEKLKEHWHDGFGFEWDHLTHPDGTVVESVWDKFNIVVDNDHVTTDHNPTSLNSVTMLYPDNSTENLVSEFSENQNGWNLTETTMSTNNISLNYSIHEQYGHSVTGINGFDSPSDWSWWWELLFWNHTNSSWDSSDVGVESINVTNTTHLAWAASNANKSLLPPPTIECAGHGWIMGSGSGAHCMCDQGYKWDGDNHLTCISKDSDTSDETTENEFNESEAYLVGHSSLTLILDQNQKKRIAWTGMDWDEAEFVADIMVLIG